MAKVFLSWSGSESKRHAIAWRRWIKKVFDGAEVFMSSKDIRPGTRWQPEIEINVRDAKVGILFVTTTNMRSPWLLFEAGALAIAKRRRLVVYMVSGSSRTLPSPLSVFQAVTSNEEGAKHIFKELKKAKVGKPKADFSLVWPKLEKMLPKR